MLGINNDGSGGSWPGTIQIIMQQFYIFRVTRIFLIAIAISVSAVACRQEKQTQVISSASPNVSPSPIGSAFPLPTVTTNPANTFELAQDKAAGGYSISQSAQSSGDWQLVAKHYRDAIALLRLVESTSPYYSVSQTKISEYQRLEQAAQKRVLNPSQASKLAAATTNIAPASVPAPVYVPVPAPVNKHVRQPVVTARTAPINTPVVTPSTSTPQSPVRITTETTPAGTASSKYYTQQTQVFSVPIKRRAGGTPVIDVTFNGNQRFEMIVDTGASGTVITQGMADALRVIPTTTSKANTASAKDVEFPIGYVSSMEASGVRVGRTPVAIAGSELETGLLGHDFFQGYDITIRRNTVEFRPHVPEPGEVNRTNPAERLPSVQVYPKPNR